MEQGTAKGNTQRQLGFNTSVFTGTGQKETSGQGLARILMAGAQAYGQKLDTDRVVEARTEKQNNDDDYVKNIQFSTARENWEVNNNYPNLKAGERDEKDIEFFEQNTPNYATDKYIYNHDLVQEKFKNLNKQLRHKELGVEITDLSHNIAKSYNGDLGIHETIDDKLDTDFAQLQGIYKDFTKKEFLTTRVNAALTKISENPEKYMAYTVDEIDREFNDVLVGVKDKSIKKPFVDAMNTLLVTSTASNGKFNDNKHMDMLSKRIPKFKSDVKTEALKVMGQKLQGDVNDIRYAVGVYETYGEGENHFHNALEANLQKGNIDYYYVTSSAVTYSTEDMSRIAALEVGVSMLGLDLPSLKGEERTNAIKSAQNMLNEKKGSEPIKLEDGDAAFVQKYKGNEREFVSHYISEAKKYAQDEKHLEKILENMYEKDSIDGVPVRSVGIQSEEQLEGFLDNYTYVVADSQYEAEIESQGNGYMISYQDQNDNDVKKFYTKPMMRKAVARYKQQESAISTIRDTVGKNTRELRDGEKSDGAYLKSLIDDGIKKYNKKNRKLTADEEKVFRVRIARVMEGRIKNNKPVSVTKNASKIAERVFRRPPNTTGRQLGDQSRRGDRGVNKLILSDKKEESKVRNTGSKSRANKGKVLKLSKDFSEENMEGSITFAKEVEDILSEQVEVESEPKASIFLKEHLTLPIEETYEKDAIFPVQGMTITNSTLISKFDMKTSYKEYMNAKIKDIAKNEIIDSIMEATAEFDLGKEDNSMLGSIVANIQNGIDSFSGNIEDSYESLEMYIDEMFDSFNKDGDTLSDAVVSAKNKSKSSINASYDRVKHASDKIGVELSEWGRIDPHTGLEIEKAERFSPVAATLDRLKTVEGDYLHKDGKNLITMPYGIVPDLGTLFREDTGEELTSKEVPSDMATLNRKQLKERINTFMTEKSGLERSDYASDKEFASAVLVKFRDNTARAVNEESVYPKEHKWDTMTATQKTVLLDLAWNGGSALALLNDTKDAVIEGGKLAPNRRTSEMVKIMKNFRSGNLQPRGLLKRRAMAYNLMARPEDIAFHIVTSAVNNPSGTRVGTKYKVKNKAGKVIFETTRDVTNEGLGKLDVPQLPIP